MTVPSALMAAGLATNEARAAVPMALTRSTIESALAVAAGQAAAVSPRVAAWTASGLHVATAPAMEGGRRARRGARRGGPGPRRHRGRLDRATARSGFAAGCAPHPAEEDRTVLQGTWSKMEELTTYKAGVAQPPKRFKQTWSITADTITVADDEGFASEVYRYTLDPTVTPATIELSSLNHGYTLHGIYRLEGDRLTLSYGHAPQGLPGKPRPGPG